MELMKIKVNKVKFKWKKKMKSDILRLITN